MRNGIGPRIGEFGAPFDARVTAREEGTPCYSGSRAPFKAVCETALQDAGAAIPFLRIMEVFRWIDTPQSPANLEEPPVLGSLKIFIHLCRNLLTDPKDDNLHPLLRNGKAVWAWRNGCSAARNNAATPIYDVLQQHEASPVSLLAKQAAEPHRRGRLCGP
jgi:hypothetical protein